MKTITNTLKSTLDYISGAKQHRTVVKRLLEKESFELKTILQGNFNNIIIFPFPSGFPPYEPCEAKEPQIKLNRLGMCLSQVKSSLAEKEMIFIQILESVAAEDAAIIIAMKDGELEKLYPKITQEAVQEAFPKLSL